MRASEIKFRKYAHIVLSDADITHYRSSNCEPTVNRIVSTRRDENSGRIAGRPSSTFVIGGKEISRKRLEQMCGNNEIKLTKE